MRRRMVQEEVLRAVKQSRAEWVEARDIAPLLNITNRVAVLALRRLEKSRHLTAEVYNDGCKRRVRFKVRR